MGATGETSPPLIERALRPFQEFSQRESSSGLLLLACTALALGWANSPWADAYAHLWEITLAVGTGEFAIRETLRHWINDGLMAVFFFLVGLEIKREVLVGELASLRRAMVPLAGALGGMIVPALLYLAANGSGPGASAGAFRWPPTSPSRSGSWRCSARGYRWP